jgi:prepilin-type N-terminal cleavage/methylation domain-containing protein
MVRAARRGFTLVELLVVIAIIGILIGLLLPAVMAARGAALRTECANNIRQLALACLQHEGRQRYFPSGGWGYRWVGDSTRGFGQSQSGSWLFSILPFVDEGNIHQMSGPTPTSHMEAIARQNQVVVSYFFCPSRRIPQTRPTTFVPYNSAPIRNIVRTDYAACAGDFGEAVMSPAEGPSPASVPAFNWAAAMQGRTGVIFVRSEITAGMIPDGLSKTLLVGEKNINPDHYDNGRSINDNQGAYSGFNWDNQRVINDNNPPTPDTPGRTLRSTFGSAHSGVWQVAMCDGSVTALAYSLNLRVAKQLANRRDGRYLAWPN